MTVLVRDIGEFGLISRLDSVLPEATRTSASVPLGIGDDAAAWQPTPGMRSVITTDTLVEGNHFRLDWTDWKSLGHKMLAVNLSDIASMGGRPVLATVTLGLTGQERVADLEDLYSGAASLAEPHGLVIAGGDIVRTTGPVILSVTVIGEAERVLRRDGARPGDRIVVSGTLGAAAAGLTLLDDPELRERATTSDLLVAAHLRPNPRISLGRLMADSGVTAMMDLSDGLLGDLPKILQASRVGGCIDSRRVPVSPAVRALFPDDWLRMALRGGEDYELLAAVPPEVLTDLQERAAGIGATLTDIGECVEPGAGDARLMMLDAHGEAHEVDGGAFDHFGTA